MNPCVEHLPDIPPSHQPNFIPEALALSGGVWCRTSSRVDATPTGVDAMPTLPATDSPPMPTDLHPTRFLLSCPVLTAPLLPFVASPCPRDGLSSASALQPHPDHLPPAALPLATLFSPGSRPHLLKARPKHMLFKPHHNPMR